jgi:hypothetical protein
MNAEEKAAFLNPTRENAGMLHEHIAPIERPRIS